MQRADAPPPGAGSKRRPRKGALPGRAGEEQRRLHELGDVLAALVRALRQDDPLAEGFARRAHELWLREQDRAVQCTTSELRVGTRVLLASSASVGHFIWPAYQAGLRVFALREKSTHADVLRLAKELAALETGALDPSAFGAWLWRGCALGLDTALTGSVAELSEMLLPVVPSETELWAACSERAAASWKDLAEGAARALPTDALRARFDAPLESLSKQALGSELLLAAEEGQRLRAAADDPTAWAAAELGLLWQQPALLAALPHAHLGFRLAELIEGVAVVDGKLLGFCASLAARAGDAHGLDHALLGDVLARRLLEGGKHVSALLALADHGPEALFSSVLSQLCARADEQAVVPVLRALLGHLGPEAMFERIDVAGLGSEAGVHLICIALDDGMPVPALLSIVARLPRTTALRALIARPALLPHAQASIEEWVTEQPLASGPMLADLVRAGPAGARAVGAVLLEQKGAGLPQPVLRNALAALVQMGQGTAFVLPLWDSRKLSSPVRLAALSALEGDSSLIAEAIRGRGATLLLEPPEIREALEELRWRQPR
ncbi:MAG: hypothetical protein ACHQ53_04815 [Polyangiales bacterium]